MDTWAAIVMVFSVSLAMGLILIWREDVWRGRMETLRADFGRELSKRDYEITHLKGMVEALVMRSGMTFNADGDVNLAGDASGRDKNVSNLNK